MYNIDASNDPGHKVIRSISKNHLNGPVMSSLMTSEQGYNYSGYKNSYHKKFRGYNQLSLLNYRGFFDRYKDTTSFISLTQPGFKSSRDLHSDLTRLFRGLKKDYGLVYWCLACENQDRGSIHYHGVLFGVPFIPYQYIVEKWGQGKFAVHIEQAKGVAAMVHILPYVKKGLRLSFCDIFYKDHLLFSPSSKIRSLVRYRVSRGLYLLDYDVRSPILVKDDRGRVIGEMTEYNFINIIYQNYKNSRVGAWWKKDLEENKKRRFAEKLYKDTLFR